jgi:peptidoglycan/LPS O-acetylase OafA/YrhL
MKKVSSIEFLRFVSSLMILVWHYQQFYLPYNFFSNQEVYFNDKSMQPLFYIFKFFYLYGNYGVEFFFIISGFVFSYVYVDKKISFRNFFINRFARLYPLHLITLIVVLILQSISFKLYNEFLIHKNNDLYHFFYNFFLIRLGF